MPRRQVRRKTNIKRRTGRTVKRRGVKQRLSRWARSSNRRQKGGFFPLLALAIPYLVAAGSAVATGAAGAVGAYGAKKLINRIENRKRR